MSAALGGPRPGRAQRLDQNPVGGVGAGDGGSGRDGHAPRRVGWRRQDPGGQPGRGHRRLGGRRRPGLRLARGRRVRLRRGRGLRRILTRGRRALRRRRRRRQGLGGSGRGGRCGRPGDRHHRGFVGPGEPGRAAEADRGGDGAHRQQAGTLTGAAHEACGARLTALSYQPGRPRPGAVRNGCRALLERDVEVPVDRQAFDSFKALVRLGAWSTPGRCPARRRREHSPSPAIEAVAARWTLSRTASRVTKCGRSSDRSRRSSNVSTRPSSGFETYGLHDALRAGRGHVDAAWGGVVVGDVGTKARGRLYAASASRVDVALQEGAVGDASG